MRSFSEMLIAIAVSLLVLSAIYAARDAFLSSQLPSRVPSQGPTVSMLPPREVRAAPEDTETFSPPAPALEPRVAPLADPAPPIFDGSAEFKAQHL